MDNDTEAFVHDGVPWAGNGNNRFLSDPRKSGTDGTSPGQPREAESGGPREPSEQNLKVHKSPTVPLPCSSPSPNTPAPGRLHNSCVRLALCRAAAFAPVGPPADGEQGKETSSHLVLGSPGSLSHVEVPRLPSPPPLTPAAHTPGCRGSLCKAALRGRVGVFPSLSISKNIYPRSTSNCG